MMRRLEQCIALAMLALSARAAAAQSNAALTTWLNARIHTIAAARIQQNDPDKTPELPAGTITRASIIDRAKLPDVAGISIAMPTSAGGNGAAQPPATSLATSPYMLWALFAGHNPLDPSQYVDHAVMRRLGFSATTETDPTTGKSIGVYQAKAIILDRGNPLADPATAKTVDEALGQAAAAIAGLQDTVAKLLWYSVGKPVGVPMVQFINGLAQQPNLSNALDKAGAAVRQQIDALITASIDKFVPLEVALRDAMNASREHPELAAGYTQRGTGGDHESRAVMIYDVGRPYVDVTANLAYNDSLKSIIGHHANLEGALQAILRLSPQDPLDFKAPLSITFAGSLSKGVVGPSRDFIGKLQALILLPVSPGVNVPLSVTWASKPMLIDEKQIVGNIGFSFDIAKIFGAAR